MTHPLLLLATALTAATAAYSYDDIVALYKAAHETALQVEAMRDTETLKVARMAYRLDGHPGEPTEDQLVALGYLDMSYVSRPRVGEQVTLPASIEEPSE